MTTLEIIGLVALVVLAIVVFVLVLVVFVFGVVPKLVFRLMKGPLEGRIAASYGADEILMKDLTANNFGLESWGVWQGRGNGALVLTKDRLHFFRFVSGGDVRVPLGAITEVSFTKVHLGKATIYDLLKVRFRVDDNPDSIAWLLADPKAWKSRIEVLKAGMAADERQ